MKIRPVGTELFHVDVQTDMKLISVFSNFANAPKEYDPMGPAFRSDRVRVP